MVALPIVLQVQYMEQEAVVVQELLEPQGLQVLLE